MSTQTPKRVQLRRSTGWRMPANAVKVDRSTRWGNPFTVAAMRQLGLRHSKDQLRTLCVGTFWAWLVGHYRATAYEDRRAYILQHIAQLRGKDLACWCPLDQPCHADVLLQLANAPIDTDPEGKG